MSAGYQELFLEQGTTFSTTVTIDDAYGTPYDLTGFTAKSQIRKSYYSTTPTADFVISIPTPENGLLTLTLGHTQTANIAAGRYVYDVVIKNTSNNVTRILEGIVNVMPQVTRF